MNQKNNIENKIIDLPIINSITKDAHKAKNIFCIGIDGPTASGKTIFANQLFKHLNNLVPTKYIQIIPLDYLLVDRSIREKCLESISRVNLCFEHEAELHMDFKRLYPLIKQIESIKNGTELKSKLVLDNLYSREDKGRCSAKIEINLSKNTILIFEPHYTARPEIEFIIDRNIVLLANRKYLIDRKIKRSSNYRDSKNVVDAEVIQKEET